MRVSIMTNKIQRTSLKSEIIRYIQNYIQENNLKPGDRLTSQEKLIEMMGVSRTSLREAMKTLEARNVLEAKNGKGIYVGSQEMCIRDRLWLQRLCPVTWQWESSES